MSIYTEEIKPIIEKLKLNAMKLEAAKPSENGAA